MSIPGVGKSFPYWPANYQEGVQSVSAGSNVSITGTATIPIINAVSPIAALTAGSNISLSGTSNITINATVPAQGVVSYNAALAASGSNVAQINDGLAGDFFGITTGAYAIGGDAYLMTVTAQITSATFATTPNGFVRFCCSVGTVVGSSPFIYFPFPKLIANVAAATDDNIITASGVFIADSAGAAVTIGIDNRTGANLGAGGLTLNLTNISIVGLGNNKNLITNWK